MLFLIFQLVIMRDPNMELDTTSNVFVISFFTSVFEYTLTWEISMWACVIIKLWGMISSLPDLFVLLILI